MTNEWKRKIKKWLTNRINCYNINESEANRRIERLALIAQLVEQRTENPRVTGSIPVQGIYR